MGRAGPEPALVRWRQLLVRARRRCGCGHCRRRLALAALVAERGRAGNARAQRARLASRGCRRGWRAAGARDAIADGHAKGDRWRAHRAQGGRIDGSRGRQRNERRDAERDACVHALALILAWRMLGRTLARALACICRLECAVLDARRAARHVARAIAAAFVVELRVDVRVVVRVEHRVRVRIGERLVIPTLLGVALAHGAERWRRGCARRSWRGWRRACRQGDGRGGRGGGLRPRRKRRVGRHGDARRRRHPRHNSAGHEWHRRPCCTGG
mmetsp:Transcript_6682/g.21108  ORF Transcript_6682/g.21108 Transcript_6682/m.21108 type:complete len:272 (-) Transcript_6682:617-1432(-)